MNSRRLNAFIDDLVAGVRPRRFDADAEDAEVLRAAIALRSDRPGDATPDTAFVASLRDELAELADTTRPTPIAPATGWHRSRVVVIGIAAAFALVGGTVAVTETTNSGTTNQSAAPALNAQALHTASFETSSGQVMGQIVVIGGHPSWVFMNVDVPHGSGMMTCQLHLANGAVVAAGTVNLRQGKGEIAKVIPMDPKQLRQATLSNSSGVVLATATFA